MRLEFELAMLKHQHEENDKQRQHEAKMEHIRHQLPSRSGPHGEDQQLGGPLDPITEIELEKMRMEFELAKLRHISEENERQRQHERKIYEDKEKQRQHEEKMEHVRQRQGNFRLSPGGGHHLFLPRDTYTLFLYCFIFTHVIYIVRELIFFLIKEHELYAFAFILLCVIKMFWK
uniref:Transmembrane protein 247 n=1 Tax=Pogona vitticeps TaxID=103695 RepID=A0ABM5FJ31_9SAUR